MKKNSKIFIFMSMLLTAHLLVSCSENQSYAEQIDTERQACNAFLANFEIREVPADSVFEVGANAPYYRLDPDGYIYMQVLKTGDLSQKAKKSQTIYFRYTRYNLLTWYNQDHYWVGSGNADDMSSPATYFNYDDYSLPVSEQWGYGIQMPMNYLGVNCEVNLVIKSKVGWSKESTYVTPYFYHVRYFRSKV